MFLSTKYSSNYCVSPKAIGYAAEHRKFWLIVQRTQVCRRIGTHSGGQIYPCFSNKLLCYWTILLCSLDI